MSYTLFAEHNVLQWQGVRPAINGTQIGVHGHAQNATTVLYTVPASRTLFVFNTWHHAIMWAMAGLELTFGVYNETPALVYPFFYSPNAGIGCVSDGNLARWVPYQVPPLYSIRCVGVGTLGHIAAGFEGVLVTPEENP